MHSNDKRTGKTGKVRGSYVSQACAFCRRRKTRCDGRRPVCTPCETSGHECTWGTESAKRPSTKQYVESLRNRIKVLEGQVADLQTQLSQHPVPPHYTLSQGNSASLNNCKPVPGPVNGIAEGRAKGSPCPGELNQDADIEQLCAPTEHLVLEAADLQLYGPTSAFRLAPKYLDHNPHQRPPAFSRPRLKHQESRFPRNERAYTLLVDDGEEEEECYVDWGRYLPLDEVPMTRREHDELLDLLFKFFMSWCLRVVPPLFLRDMHTALSAPLPIDEPSVPSSSRVHSTSHGAEIPAPPKTSHYSPMLHNSLIAVASAFSSNPAIKSEDARQCLIRRAKSYIERECERPGISCVHALDMIASFHSSRGEQTLGYMYFGMSGRISQALGLHVDCSPWVQAGIITKADMFDRNWAHWTTFCNDVLWSLFVGRDFCVSATDQHHIPVPFEDAEFDALPWNSHTPPASSPDSSGSGSGSSEGEQPHFLSKTFVATCELMQIARRIMEVVNGLACPNNVQQVNYALITGIDVELNTWKEHLSPDVDITHASRQNALPHRLMLHLTYWWLFILLHRPFYRRPRSTAGMEGDIDHVKLCNRAADNIMELLGTWRSLYSLRYAPVTLIQVVFSAGTIFLLAAVQATSGARLAHVSLAHSLSQAESCVQYMTETGESWQAANQMAAILGNLLKEQLKPRLAMRSYDPELVSARPTHANDGRQRPLSDLKVEELEQFASPSSSHGMSSGSGFTTSSLAGPLANKLEPDNDPTYTRHSAQIPSMAGNSLMHRTSHGGWGDLSTMPSSDIFPPSPMTLDGAGFPGMGLGTPGGETLPSVPFMAFGMPPQPQQDYGGGMYGGGYGDGDSGGEYNPFEASPFLLTEQDVGNLQQFLDQQQGHGQHQA